MQYNSADYQANALAAQRLENPDKTIAVLMDDRPGFCAEAARALICAMMEMGYLVHEVSAKAFCKMDITSLGCILVLPHAESIPAMCAEPLENYWKQGGRVLVLGGPLFAQRIEPGENGFVAIPLDDQTLDAAVSGNMYRITMEGIVPSYKVYEVDDANCCMAEAEQFFVTAAPEIQKGERLICASARPHGLGYQMERRNRYIPLVQAMGDGGRADGRRGPLAHIMLSDVCMKRPGVDGNKFGYVMPTTRGGCTAAIGLKRQDILSIPGMRKLLEQILHALHSGLFLFEGGSEKFVAQAGETLRLGARIMNQRAEYVPCSLKMRVLKAGMEIFCCVQDLLASPGDFTDLYVPYRIEEPGEYQVEVFLQQQGTTVDAIQHEMFAPALRKSADADAYVRLENGGFTLHGQPWYAFGINYWPLYYPGFEMTDYWMGWLDKANYDPREVERDLALLEEMGLNCLFTRIDGNVMGRCIDSLKDFMLRCERHGMKLSLSYCNVTSPLNYQAEAFDRFMRTADLYENPVLFAHDIAWEIGSKFFSPAFMASWDSEWERWIEDRYGSIENAQRDWGVPVDRLANGKVVAPPIAQFRKEGAWRVKICAYRRFIDDFASRKWNDAVSDMRKKDPHHLIAYRMGPIGENSAALTAACKHIDFASPEGYSVSNDENGLCNACAITTALQMTTREKPVVWSEYGVSLTDVRWRKLVWDNVHSRPFAWKEQEQTEYLRMLYRVFELTHVCGSAPWWFPGGFRYVEMSDFGFCGPNGLLRPGAQSYVRLGEWFKAPREKRPADTVVTLDPDTHAAGWSHLLRGPSLPDDESRPVDGNGQRLLGEVRGEASRAIQRAIADGKTVAFRTPGTGCNSANLPRIAIGNVPMNGHNPPKYLNAEFNWLEAVVDNAKAVLIRNGAVLHGSKIRLRANVGNLQEAEWLRPKVGMQGGVWLLLRGPKTERASILANTPYLQDTCTEWIEISEPGLYALCMEAGQISPFGEVWRIRIER